MQNKVLKFPKILQVLIKIDNKRKAAVLINNSIIMKMLRYMRK